MLILQDGTNLPGWRDFERSVALVFNGEAQESKAVFDVVVPVPGVPRLYYGLSCKMRGTLTDTQRNHRITIELSNSAKKFWDELSGKGIDRSNIKDKANEAGNALIALVESWHVAESISARKPIDITKSSYLVLSWRKPNRGQPGLYQLHRFLLSLPKNLIWSFPLRHVNGIGQDAERLVGSDGSRTVFEWYGNSGGQLKYYPSVTEATWVSEPFELEPLGNNEVGMLAKVAAQFPEQWQRVSE
jgi:hypothetical protein